MAESVIVVGVQWGDEGKGKIIDLLSQRSDYVVRAQGGNNAGHSIKVGDAEYKFHLVPSGALYPSNICLITGGTVIDLAVLKAEINSLQQAGINLSGRLKISSYAHVIMPYHKIFDMLYEKQKGKHAVGTTGKGIGPCYSDKALRIGFQLGEFLRLDQFKDKLEHILKIKNTELSLLFNHEPLVFSEVFDEYNHQIAFLRDFIFEDVESDLALALDNNKKVLFEGAHGTFLDTTYGTYPYVTSSHTLASGVSAGAGIGPTRISHVLGVVKAYTTRVGNGPLPSALSDLDSLNFMDNIAAREVGTTTGRNRRLGWFDAPLVRYAIGLNGIDSMAIMKLDILDQISKIKICVSYKLRDKIVKNPP